MAERLLSRNELERMLSFNPRYKSVEEMIEGMDAVEKRSVPYREIATPENLLIWLKITIFWNENPRFDEICQWASIAYGYRKGIANLGRSQFESMRENDPQEFYRLVAIQAGELRETPLYTILAEKFLRSAGIDLTLAKDKDGEPLEKVVP